jgi:NAD(P) transhydrogenase subunit beta
LLLLLIVGGSAFLTVSSVDPSHVWLFVCINVVALILGVLLVIPIGGADMPVVISLLNSYSGLAAATTGFVIYNHGLIITGALVGASGIILTQIMCKAMNRSLANVVFGGVGGRVAGPAGAANVAGKTVREITAEDTASLLAYAQNVCIVPGYGLAVAQAQHQVRELTDLLEKRGVSVTFGIHPVAGRMPGHMNVLLAEANVPYDKLLDMDTINPQFERTDVVVVVGANDVVNPAARTSPNSPLYGMPILDVDKARQVIFMKRSLNPGFAGIDNELFYNEKTQMLFGDAKATLTKLVAEVKQV